MVFAPVVAVMLLAGAESTLDVPAVRVFVPVVAVRLLAGALMVFDVPAVKVFVVAAVIDSVEPFSMRVFVELPIAVLPCPAPVLMFVAPITVLSAPVMVFETTPVIVFVWPEMLLVTDPVELPMVLLTVVPAIAVPMVLFTVEPASAASGALPMLLVTVPAAVLRPNVFVPAFLPILFVPALVPIWLSVAPPSPNVFVVPALLPTVELPDEAKAPVTARAGAALPAPLVLATANVGEAPRFAVKLEPVAPTVVPLLLIVPVALIEVAPLVIFKPFAVELIVSPVSGAVEAPIVRPVPTPAPLMLMVSPVVVAVMLAPVVGLTIATAGIPIVPEPPTARPVVVAEMAIPVANGSTTIPVPKPLPLTWIPPPVVATVGPVTCKP